MIVAALGADGVTPDVELILPPDEYTKTHGPNPATEYLRRRLERDILSVARKAMPDISFLHEEFDAMAAGETKP